MDFVIDKRQEIVLPVKLRDGTVSTMAEETVHYFNEDVLMAFWLSRGSRETASGVGKRGIYRVLAYRSLFHQATNDTSFGYTGQDISHDKVRGLKQAWSKPSRPKRFAISTTSGVCPVIVAHVGRCLRGRMPPLVMGWQLYVRVV
ncbi:hypothetical protein FSARC_14961 [Fusarium sarcochroum]|uniref:Uncharacterized protein n=1 Tax=Fusarium sarcochroum TaxID=1208366 RepID=A0A8H4SPV0_9HYPO|nr:hypothetical protein FSARC_14961 [Fusarium sarcochroum]